MHVCHVLSQWTHSGSNGDLFSGDLAIIDPSYKSHNASDKYATMHHFVTEMCTSVPISVTKRGIVVYRTGVCWNLCERFIKTLGPRQNGRHFADEIFGSIFLCEKFFWFQFCCLPNDLIKNSPALARIMAYIRTDDKPFSDIYIYIYIYICI